MKRILAVGLLASAFAVAATSARADQDAIQFFNNIHVTPETPVHDAVCFFCSVRVEGKVTGDIVVFFGSIHLDGDAQHDVVNIFGNIAAADNSSIENDVVSVFGRVRLGENVTVGKDLVAIFGTLRTAASASVSEDRVVWPGWVFFGPLLVVLLVVFLAVREFQSYRRRLVARGYQFPPHPSAPPKNKS
jgi:hypothetical protein